MPLTGAVRRERLARARLYVVTGARQQQGDLRAFVDSVLGAGAGIVQLREKDAEAGDLLRWAIVFRDAAHRHGALFIVNDRPDVALAAGADGVHLGQNDLPITSARAIVGPEMLIGLSTHSRLEFERASPDADYLCAGPVHETPTKPGRPAAGLHLIRDAAERSAMGAEKRPWFAIGGIDSTTLAEVVQAGARRVVVVRAVTESLDPARAVATLLDALRPAAAPGARKRQS